MKGSLESRFSGTCPVLGGACPASSQVPPASNLYSIQKFMARRLARFLCFAALLVQVGVGALPAGEFCLGCPTDSAPRPPRPACCCDDEDAPADHAKCVCPMGAEPGQGGCDRCLRVRVPERDATVAVRASIDFGNGHALILPPLPVPQPPLVLAPLREHVHSPPTESPPHLGPLSTIHLIV